MAAPALLAIALLTAAPSPLDSFLRQYAVTHRFQSGEPTAFQLTPDGRTALYLRAPGSSEVQALYALDVDSGRERELANPAALLSGRAQNLSAAERAQLERRRISAQGITDFSLSEDGRRGTLSLSGELYVFEVATGRCSPAGVRGALDPRLSPDGSSLAFVREADLYVKDLGSERETRLTEGGTAVRSHGLAEFAAQEEMGRFHGYVWSPDGRWLAFEEADTRELETWSIVDPLHPEHGAQSFPYPRAGGPNAHVRVGLVPATGGAVTWVAWDAQRYPYLTVFKWPEHGPLSLVVMDRGQREEQLLKVDLQTGATSPLLTERDAAWLQVEQAFPVWLRRGGFLWRTERSGGPEIELRGTDGTLLGTWVGPAAQLDQFVGLSPDETTLYFTARPQAPWSVLMRAARGGAPTRVWTRTSGAVVQAAVLSRGGSAAVLEEESPTALPRAFALRLPGGRAVPIPSTVQRPPFVPRLELRKVGVGEGFWTYLVRPRAPSVPPRGKLPVLLHVYGGPTATVVHAGMREYLLDQWLADQGFLVVGVDNRGTPGRSRAWERAIAGSFAEVPLADQVTGLLALAEEVPEMDLSRVGVFGWSFGGYLSALALLRRPDLFKAAVAGAPVVDWRDYDTFYTERYLGLPRENPEGYRQSSLLTWVDGLKGALLLIHGTADDNVYLLHSLKLSDALFRAGKPHELLPLSGLTHMVPDPLVTERLWQRVRDHFKGHLQ